MWWGRTVLVMKTAVWKIPARRISIYVKCKYRYMTRMPKYTKTSLPSGPMMLHFYNYDIANLIVAAKWAYNGSHNRAFVHSVVFSSVLLIYNSTSKCILIELLRFFISMAMLIHLHTDIVPFNHSYKYFAYWHILT